MLTANTLDKKAKLDRLKSISRLGWRALLLLSFPLCIGSLDLSDVGPPPMT